MFFNSTETTSNTSTNIRSVFYCPKSPEFTWDLNNTTLRWILIIILYIASPITIILNVLVIIAVKRRKELQRQSNILLSSLAVTDLVVGVITMPLSATVDVLIFRQVSFKHICLLDNLNVYSMYCVSLSSLYHLTAIAWERYVAIVKWIDYKVIATRSRVKKLAIICWLTSMFLTVPIVTTELAGVDPKIVSSLFNFGALSGAVALIALVYFYVMVFLGIRKRKASQIRQVNAVVKAAELESRVAKTTALLTTAVIFAFIPAMIFFILGKIFPSLPKVTFRLWDTLVLLNSLVNPIIYYYRDSRFRNAVLEMLRMRKPQATQPAVGTARHVRRNNLFAAEKDVPGLQNVDKPTCSIHVRAVSCDLAVVSDILNETSQTIMLKRSMSAPSLDKGTSLLVGLQPQQPSPTLITTATINFESAGVRNKATKRLSGNPKLENDVKSQGTVNRIHNVDRSKSWDCSIFVNFANSCPKVEDRVFEIRPKSAPSFGSAIPIVLDEASTDSGFNTKL